jgi:mRNA-degrading endonuclease RelE of RelBE toxin-antitoxin system
MFKLIVLPVVDRVFKKISKKDKTHLAAINNKIMQIRQNPKIGKPLHFPLQNLRRTRVFKSFVLVYDIQKKEQAITIRAYEHHDNVYKKKLFSNFLF